MPENQKVSAVIEGFYFENEQEIERAKREIEGIAYIRSNTDMQNPETVLQLYRKLTEEHIFQTPIGVIFLKELWDYLAGIPQMQGQELLPIHILVQEKEPEKKQASNMPVRGKSPEKKNELEKPLKQVRKNLKISLLLNLFLLILSVGMIIISVSGDNLNIMNYENKIINKYADWEQELKQRETQVKSKEEELGITP